MPEFRTIDANRVRLRVAIEEGDTGPLVLFVHGFPESWYSWRHQLKAVSEAGFRAAALDVRGYGGSDKPHDVLDYTIDKMIGDFVAITEALSEDGTAVIVGHDWGASMAWNAALFRPDVFRAVAGLSVPYTPPGPIAPIDLYNKIFTENGLFFYQVYFQQEGLAEAELEADPARTIRLFYYSASGDLPDHASPFKKGLGDVLLTGMEEPPMPLSWLSNEDVAYYAAEFAKSGFRGPLNKYRTSHEDFAFLTSRSEHTIKQPSLFIGGDKDPVLALYPNDAVSLMEPYLADLRGVHILPGCGHWTQQERPGEVNRLLVDWLKAL